jgi:hypothetical protein
VDASCASERDRRQHGARQHHQWYATPQPALARLRSCGGGCVLSSLPATLPVCDTAAVTVLDNPTLYTNPFQFEITFECLEALQDGA